MSNKLGYTQKDAAELVATITGRIVQDLQENGSVCLPDFGTFEVKKKNERIVVNPQTKQRILVPPKLTAVFKPCARLKERIKQRVYGK